MSPSTADRTLLVCIVTPPRIDAGLSIDTLRAAGVTDIQTVELERPGAWAAARNEALQRAIDHELVGLVEAGVAVAPTWLQPLNSFASGCGVIGGAVTAVHGPAGVDGAKHAQVLGLSDGSRPTAGNAVLDTAALRAVGGFAPNRGHAASVDELTDWQLVLEAIAAAGWLIETDARMDATRDLTHISAATLLRRRLHTGARSAALNPQLAAEHPLLGAARSAGAATGRLARGDISGTVDRLAWGSAQLGAALGARIAHAELQPDRTSTPWRPSVAPPQPRRPRKRRRSGAARGTVLLYHRVCELPDDPLGVAVSPQHFAEQMAVLVADDRPAALADVVSGAAGPRAVAVTFDDGYVDNLLHALPILQRYSVPATLFASTGHIATGDGFWWDELQRSVEAALSGGEPGPLSLELPSGKRTWRPDVDTPIGSLLDWLHAAIRPLPVAEVAAAVSAIRDWAGVESHPPERDRPLTASELKRLADAGPFDVQAHGRNHLSMAFMDSRTRSDEMVGSADDIESWLGRRPTQFAYPFGVPGVDVDAGSRKDAAAAGFSIAVVNAADAPAGNQHAVPRLAVPDVGGPAFAELIASRAR